MCLCLSIRTILLGVSKYIQGVSEVIGEIQGVQLGVKQGMQREFPF
jgi:hypothetical protein